MLWCTRFLLIGVAAQIALFPCWLHAQGLLHPSPVAESLAKQASRLYADVTSSTDAQHPDRLPEAERSVAHLSALGGDDAGWQFLAHRRLALAYEHLGQSTPALTHALAAFARVPSMPFEDRALGADLELYLLVANLFSECAEGRQHRNTLDTLLLRAFQPPPDRVALEPRFIPLQSRESIHTIHIAATLAATLGRAAPPLVGNVWINASDTTSDTTSGPRPLTPGVVYVLDFFQASHAPTLPMQVQLAHLPTRFGRAVHVIGITNLEGHWGLQFVTPQEEVRRWTQVFHQQLALPFPITFWVQPKTPNVEGGRLPPIHPTFVAYHVDQIPTPVKLVVVDARGRIRRVFLADDRNTVDEVGRFLEALLHEPAGAGSLPPTRSCGVSR